MQDKGISQNKLAEILETDQPSISRMLKLNGVGTMPESWEKLLDALGLKLVVAEK
jgi:predicted XRE-type DNA-binding protein